MKPMTRLAVLCATAVVAAVAGTALISPSRIWAHDGAPICTRALIRQPRRLTMSRSLFRRRHHYQGQQAHGQVLTLVAGELSSLRSGTR
jgi:hypothetical protein